jgi:hypothetical protein
MKIIVATFLGILILGSCKKQTVNQVEKAVIEGEWKVTLFQEDGVNETTDFSAFNFSFKENGSVEVKSSSTLVYTGTWKVEKDSDHVEFVLGLGEVEPLGELTDDWHIESNSDNKLELKDESGDGSFELLTFEKI